MLDTQWYQTLSGEVRYIFNLVYLKYKKDWQQYKAIIVMYSNCNGAKTYYLVQGLLKTWNIYTDIDLLPFLVPWLNIFVIQHSFTLS